MCLFSLRPIAPAPISFSACFRSSLTRRASITSVDQLVSQVFRRAKKTFIKKVYDERGSPTLFQLYWILSEHDYREQAAALEHSRREWNPIEFDGICAESSFDGDLSSLSRELFAARRIAAFKGHEAFTERREMVNREKAVADGALRDCGCCFSDEPVNRMVSCDVDTEHVSSRRSR